MITTDRSFAGALIVFIAGTLIAGQTVDHYGWPVLLMPLVVGTVAVVLLGMIVLRASVPVEDDAGEEATLTDADEPAPHTLRQDIGGMVQVLLLIPVLWGLGFLFGLPIYVTGLVRFHGHGWVTAVAFGIAMLVFSYLVFWQLLTIPLPMKPLFLS